MLDAYALIFRAYYALIKVPRMTRSGLNTSAIFGFVNTLEEVLRRENPSHIAVCFDPQGPTFRSEAYADYKGERDATPEDIKLSIPYIKQIIEAYRIPLLEVEGFEADDVIGTMARRAEKEGYTTYMMTPDKDFGQLVSPSILQYKPAYRGQDFELRGEQEVCERYGLERTSQVIDLLALMGDKIDNIPGCPGVGEKTAAKLIQEFGTVENLLVHTSELKGALQKKVVENAEQIRFSKYLATIRTDVPIEESVADLARRTPDRDKLFALFRELEFRQLADRVARRLGDEAKAAAPSRQPSLFDDEDFGETANNAVIESVADSPIERVQQSIAPAAVKIVSDAASLTEMKEVLTETGVCGMSLATIGENDMAAEWKGAAFSLADGRGWYVPADFEEGMAAVLDIMARPDLEKVTASAKRDMVMASRRRNDSEKSLVNFYDVTLAHYLLQPEMRHGISHLAEGYLGVELAYDEAVETPQGKKKAEIPTDEEIALRGVTIALALLKVKPLLEAELKKEGLEKLLVDLELPLARVLADMEMTGVCLDVEALKQAEGEMENRMRILEKEVWSLAGEEFNVGSPSQVGEILFGKLELDPKAKKTKTGQYSTSEEVLEKVAHKNPIVGKILEYRQVKKLINTYLTVLPDCINKQTGRIHTNYNQAITATGRISSSSPNLQNIPIREEMGRGIRRAFIASPGNLFLSADYSQIELRLVADFAGEEVMTEAFRTGRDIHAITAAKIYHKQPEEVTDDERRHAKTANFGILYGISAFGLSSRLGIPRQEAKDLIDNYFKTFPAIHRYMSSSIEEAREKGYTLTKMGRKRRLPDINSKNPVVRGVAERNAINAPVQGAAADIIKLAMIRIAEEMRERGLKSKMTMQVHDELNFDVVPEELPVMQELVARQMEGAWQGNVTLTAQTGVGANWLEAH